MALRNKLLATVAIPLIALTGLAPVHAAQPTPPAIHSPQSTDATLVDSEQDMLRQQRQQQQEEKKRKKEEKRQKKEQAQGDDQNEGKPRRKDRQQQNDDNGGDDQNARPRKNNADNGDDQQPPKRRPKNDDNGGDDQNARPRKNNADNGDDQPPPKRRPKNDDNGGDQQRPRKRDNGSIEEIQTQPDGQDDDNTPRRNRDGKRDPRKDQDGAERLPVENGAAILDSDKDGGRRDDKGRDGRKHDRDNARPARVPKSDRDAQAGFDGDKRKPIRVRPVLEERGERLQGFRGYDLGEGRRLNDNDDRVVIQLDGRDIVRDDDGNRVGRRGQTHYEQLDNGRIREVVVRPDGSRVVTIRNQYGEIIRRSRIQESGRETLIFYSPELESGRNRLYLEDPGRDLPPMRLNVPVDDYIIDVSREPKRDYVEFLEEPPVEPVERVYSVDEVKYSARIRDKVRRIDLDTLTFDTGSAEVPMSQASTLKRVGAAIKQIIDRDPGETFMIEGHTDAVGSDESNLVLSDKRAESVAEVLTDMFDIPAENLVTQGYGERYLKINTDGPQAENRRVTIRRITSLVRPVAQAE